MASARLNIRITRDQKHALIEKAHLKGVPLVDFLLSAALGKPRPQRSKTRSILFEAEETKRPQINIRCDAETKTELEQLASDYGLTTGEYILKKGLGLKMRKGRRLLSRRMEEGKLKELEQQGLMLNGIALKLNCDRYVPPMRIFSVLTAIEGILYSDPATRDLFTKEQGYSIPLFPIEVQSILRIRNNLRQVSERLGGGVSTLKAKCVSLTESVSDALSYEADKIFLPYIKTIRR